jgi:hypothetical protein
MTATIEIRNMDSASVTWTLRLRDQIMELVDHRDLLPDAWDAAKILNDKAISALVVRRYDFAEQLCEWAQEEIDKVAKIADEVDPLDFDDLHY